MESGEDHEHVVGNWIIKQAANASSAWQTRRTDDVVGNKVRVRSGTVNFSSLDTVS